jgi:2-polyprenyl-3-methyl-5-hydroxy-6-metoxy-1,4-benzoquinol methylase
MTQHSRRKTQDSRLKAHRFSSNSAAAVFRESRSEPGHYARKQLFSRNRLVAWSHTARFATARRLVTPHAGQRLLDYGCGDGTFVALVHDLFPSATAVDVSISQTLDCAVRFAALRGISFSNVDPLDDPSHAHAFDVVTCMEVLEHCPDDVQNDVLDRIARVTAPDGVVIISVPLETGLSLVAKQLARRAVALSGLTEYANVERYRAREFTRMVFAGPDTMFLREEQTGIDENGRTYRFTGHKGFNWRRLEKLLKTRFTVERRLFSPVGPLGAALNSQVWFVCRKQ